MTTAQIVALHTSDGGAPKHPVERVQVLRGGIEGDRQAHPKFHGGPERAVCLFSTEVMERLRAEGHPIGPGQTGENVTLTGIDWAQLTPGRTLAFAGGVQLTITSYARPCRQIRHAFEGGDFERIHQERHAGESRVYARVDREGELSVGEAVELLP